MSANMLPYIVRYDSAPMSSHRTMQHAIEAAAELHERHGMPLDRLRIFDRRPDVAFSEHTLTREAIAYVATPVSAGGAA